ncbi:hypothetical protein K523DRAFT_146892 [Schizophyllum commune Tattone D]|nr:hypothetical protein K523DRAFT_146892 [Schizophyllum commune Tattone D]
MLDGLRRVRHQVFGGQQSGLREPVIRSSAVRLSAVETFGLLSSGTHCGALRLLSPLPQKGDSSDLRQSSLIAASRQVCAAGCWWSVEGVSRVTTILRIGLQSSCMRCRLQSCHMSRAHLVRKACCRRTKGMLPPYRGSAYPMYKTYSARTYQIQDLCTRASRLGLILGQQTGDLGPRADVGLGGRLEGRVDGLEGESIK